MSPSGRVPGGQVAQVIAIPRIAVAPGVPVPVPVSVARWPIWTMIAATAALTAVLYRATGTRLDVGPNWPAMLLALAVLLAVSWFYHSIRPSPLLSGATETAVQLVLIAALATLLNFGLAVAGAGFAYRDPLLARWDRALGFDWRSYVGFVDARPLIQPIMTACYLSIDFSYPVVQLALVLSGRRRDLDRFIVALWVSLMLTMAIFLFVPATAAYAHFGVTLRDLHTLTPTFLVNRFLPLLQAMREAGPHVVRLDDLEGLVTFPSFHMEAAILFTWAVWPLRWVRWPMLVVNAIMVSATPVEGAHYAVDVVAGALVAVVAITVAVVLDRRWASAAAGKYGGGDAG